MIGCASPRILAMSKTFPKPAELDSNVVVYGTPWCPFCQMAKHLLQRRNIPFAWVDVTGDREARAWLANESQQDTVPQIFIFGESTGGYQELSEMDQSGELRERLSAEKPST